MELEFASLELEFARLDFQCSKKFTQLELEFAKLKFHVVFFFFKLRVGFMLVGPRVRKLNFGLELEFDKLEFQNQSN